MKACRGLQKSFQMHKIQFTRKANIGENTRNNKHIKLNLSVQSLQELIVERI